MTSRPPASSGGETFLAVRNAFTLGGSLLLTGVIAIGMRLLLPRFLGPERFGELSFADAFTTTCFLVLGLGVDGYVRKEVSVRRDHASEFFGGTLVVRACLAALLFAGMALVLHATSRSRDVTALVFLFAIGQLFVTANGTLSALLHATGTVGGMSALSVAAKICWAGLALVAVASGAGLWTFAAAFVATEALRCALLFALARRHVALVIRVDPVATRAMMIASLPFYANTFASAAYGRLDLTLLDMSASNLEVGWYAAASAIAGLTLLATPIIDWVLMPALARAAARSHDELYAQVRRATEVILALAIPVSLLVCLGADVWVRLAFGEAFAPAVLALRIRATMFVLTHVAIVYALTLMMLGRAWTLAAISLSGLAVNVALNLVFLPHATAVLGPGGGGAGCALAMLGTELFVTGAMVAIVGRRTFDRRSVETVLASLFACVVVAGVDRGLRHLGGARLVVDGVVYLVVAGIAGASRSREIVTLVAAFLEKRGAQAPDRAP